MLGMHRTVTGMEVTLDNGPVMAGKEREDGA